MSSDWRSSPEGVAWALENAAKAEKQARQHQQRRGPMQVNRDLLAAQQREQQLQLQTLQHHQQQHEQTQQHQLQHAALVAEAAGVRLELAPVAAGAAGAATVAGDAASAAAEPALKAGPVWPALKAHQRFGPGHAPPPPPGPPPPEPEQVRKQPAHASARHATPPTRQLTAPLAAAAAAASASADSEPVMANTSEWLQPAPGVAAVAAAATSASVAWKAASAAVVALAAASKPADSPEPIGADAILLTGSARDLKHKEMLAAAAGMQAAAVAMQAAACAMRIAASEMTAAGAAAGAAAASTAAAAAAAGASACCAGGSCVQQQMHQQLHGTPWAIPTPPGHVADFVVSGSLPYSDDGDESDVSTTRVPTLL